MIRFLKVTKRLLKAHQKCFALKSERILCSIKEATKPIKDKFKHVNVDSRIILIF